MRTLAALIVVAAVLLAGCSEGTSAPPAMTSTDASEVAVAAPDGKGTVHNPRKLGPQFDCAGLISPKEFKDILGARAKLTKSTPKRCVWALSGALSGKADIGAGGTSQGTQTANFDDNTAFQLSHGPGSCVLVVAANRSSYLQAQLQVGSGTKDPCDDVRAWLKVVWDRLPGGHD